MTDYRVGGRGKAAPWGDTVPVRIPSPLKDLVNQLFAGYRQVYGTYREKIYLDSVQRAAVDGLGLSAENKPTQEPSDLTEQVKDLQRKLEASQACLSAIEEIVSSYERESKTTRDWTKANQLIAELKRLN